MSDQSDKEREGASTNATVPHSDNDQLINRFLFKKDLNEVHLLIDLVSGRADRSLSILSMPDPDNPSNLLTSSEILQRITMMRYPPKDTDAMNAANATILLMAKDRLSALADPARASTIAYTTIFVDSERRVLWPGFFKSILPKLGFHVPEQVSNDTGVDLAISTFPGFQAHAARFSLYRTILGWFVIVWLLLTALTLWDASLGRTALEHTDQNWKAYIDAARENPELVNTEGGCDLNQVLERRNSSPAGTDASVGKGGETVSPVSDAGRLITACRKINYLRRMTRQSSEEIRSIFNCTGYTAFFHIWCWHGVLADAFRDSDDSGAPVPWQAATSKLSVYTSYILPMMFALLGTLIGAFRAILHKIGNSSLAPRDMVGMLVGVPVGLVAGFAVGLFFSPSTIPVQGAGEISGTFSLAASALGFIAGYASQSFFNYLDNVVGTMFPSNTSNNVRATAVAAAAHDSLVSTAPRATASGTSTPPTTTVAGRGGD